VGVAPRIRPLHNPPHPGLEWGGLAFLGDHANQAAALQDLSGDLGVVGTVEVDAGVLRQPPEGVVEGLAQKRRVVVVGRGGNSPKWDARSVYHLICV
jgi:hypothetical protein